MHNHDNMISVSGDGKVGIRKIAASPPKLLILWERKPYQLSALEAV